MLSIYKYNKMRKQNLKTVLLALSFCALAPTTLIASPNGVKSSKEIKREKTVGDSTILTIKGTNNTATFSVSASDLNADQEISITASHGFIVSPSKISAEAKNEKIMVKLTSYKAKTYGKVILRSGDTRSYIYLVGIGTPLKTKNLSNAPVYKGGEVGHFIQTAKDGFKPAGSGYTIEFRVKTGDKDKLFVTHNFYPYVVDSKGIGFKGYVSSEGFGMFSSSHKESFENPITSVPGGSGKFYNNDGRFHVYRYAVTPDKRVFIYRDGYPIDTVRAADYGPQPNFAGGIGDPKRNLLKNSGFEGEFDTSSIDQIATAIAGWHIAIGDIWNSRQFIVHEQINYKQDFNNQILRMKRYKWQSGWSAARVSQVVDVAPNSTYTLTALVRGGIKKGTGPLGKIKLEEVQNDNLGTSTQVTSDNWETYSLSYTTSAKCKQLRVTFYLERDKRGADISPLEVDNVKLTGKSRLYIPQIGFNNNNASIDYFTYDVSGAYAPVKQPKIKVSL